jgi:serine/threonine protein kinase
MPSHRWPQITELFHAARARDPATRGSFLTEACQGDQSLRDELERLLGADATAGSFLETSLFPPTDVPRFEPGARLGPYDLKGLLGAGGMGEVFRAHDPRLNRDIAIKVLPLDAAADAERLARFAREAQAIGALNHPNIVTIHSVEQAREVQFLTMELVNGKTLRECIPRGGLPIDRFLDMAIALADAIGTAHLHNVVHRDLKPTNVMVTSEGRVKVLDFGLAKLTPRAAPTGDSATVAPPEPTGEGRVLGTTGYMSPEQAGGGEVDHRSDIFSIGIVLYEMATGQRPFRGESNTSLLSSILEEVPPPVTALRPDLPPALATRIRRCLAKDPNRRYQSALDLRNELDEIRQDLSSGRLAATGGAAGEARCSSFWVLCWLGPSPALPTSPGSGQHRRPHDN